MMRTLNRTFRHCSSSNGYISQKQVILFLSSASWPQPNATAAGTRTNSLLELFTTYSKLFTSAHFGCGSDIPTSSPSAHDLNDMHEVQRHHIKMNRQLEMKDLLSGIQNEHGPIKAVVFDRFYSEEAYSFMIKESCPNALRILDMQDVHSLRIGRQNLVKTLDRDRQNLSWCLMDKVMTFDPKENCEEDTSDKYKIQSRDVFLRELASIHRSDLVFVCSSAEMKLLHSWNVPSWKLALASFFCDKVDREMLPSFQDRCDFVTVGGFKHKPNIDSVKFLRYEIWPRIRSQLNNANLHIYGAYPTHEIQSLHDDRSGFLVHGRIDDLDNELKKRRVLLAPLRFGAGIKGKIVDAWRCGCPVIATPVGAEGMMDDGNMFEWGGAVASDTNSFVESAVNLYTNDRIWNRSKERSTVLLHTIFGKEHNFNLVESAVKDAIDTLKERRACDITSAMLWHQNMRSTNYFSKWIELKEKML